MINPRCKTFLAVIAAVLAALPANGCADKAENKSATNGGNGSHAESSEEDDQADAERDFFPLSLEDFDVFPAGAPGSTWAMSGDVLTCTGQPKGYIYTKEVYDNFTLRFDYQFSPPGSADDEKKLNTGALIYIKGDHKTWPVSLEVQGKYAEIGKIKANGGAEEPQVVDNEQARQQARRPPGEWNSVEVISKGGALTVNLNGTLVCKSEPGELKDGRLGFQSEGVEVRFRKIRIFVHDPDAG